MPLAGKVWAGVEMPMGKLNAVHICLVAEFESESGAV